MQRVYTVTVRPSITYDCNAWYTPTGLPEYRKLVARKLQAIQGRCFRVIAGAYKATSTEALEIETFTPPLNIYMDVIIARTNLRLLLYKSKSAEKTVI
jgi:hypothetical protein